MRLSWNAKHSTLPNRTRSSRGGELRAFDKEIGQHFIVGLIDQHSTIVGLEFAATGRNAIQEFIDFGEVLFPNQCRLCNETAAGFQVHESDRTIKFEFQFGGIEQMKY